jgi:hypothetical protein
MKRTCQIAIGDNEFTSSFLRSKSCAASEGIRARERRSYRFGNGLELAGLPEVKSIAGGSRAKTRRRPSSKTSLNRAQLLTRKRNNPPLTRRTCAADLQIRAHVAPTASHRRARPDPSRHFAHDSWESDRHPVALFYRANSQASSIVSSPRLPDERIALLALCRVHRARRHRQLQHGRVLAFAQPGEQHGLPVGEL